MLFSIIVHASATCRCFLPTVLLKAGKLPEQEVLAVVVNASQVNKAWTGRTGCDSCMNSCDSCMK